MIKYFEALFLIMTAKVIEMFLKEYNKESTRYGYASALYSFFSVIYNYSRNPRVSQSDKEHFEMLAERYLTEDRDYTEDIISFSKKCGKPTKTIKMYQSVVVEFLKRNKLKKIKLDGDANKEIGRKTPQKHFVSTDKELTLEVIRTILQHADVRMQALLYVLLSSGLRISEALSIRLEDYEKIEDGFGKLKLTWLHAKASRELYTLITPECVRIVDEWLKVRQKYINEKCINEKLKIDDTRIFPFSKNVANVSFNNILERAGLKEPNNGKKSPYHFHLFRAYFLSQMNLVVPTEITKYLIAGHSRNIDAIYRKYSFRQVLDAYKDACDVLTIGTDPVLKKQYKQSIEEVAGLKKNISVNNDQVSTLIAQIGAMQAKIKVLEDKQASLEINVKGWQELFYDEVDGKTKSRVVNGTIFIDKIK
jgi:integrase